MVSRLISVLETMYIAVYIRNRGNKIQPNNQKDHTVEAKA